MPIFNNVLAGAAGQSGGAGEFKIERSLRFDSGSSSYLSRTPSSVGNQKKWTWSGWVKRSTVDDGSWRGLFTAINPDNSNRNDGIWYSGTGTQPNDQLYISFGNNTDLQFTPQFRDTSAWYSLVVSVDSSHSDASKRIQAWVNGIQLSVESGSQPAQNYAGGINNNVQHSIGRRDSSGTQYFDGYLAEVYFLDGIAVSDPDGVFGEFSTDTGVWNPIAFTGNYGTNGYHLDFSNNSSDAALGYDAVGSNNWTVNNISSQDAVDYSTGTFSVQYGGSMLYEAQSFNGSTTDGAIQNGISSGTNEHTWTPSSPITGVTSLRIYMRRSDASGGDSNFQYKINTGSYVNSGIAQNGSGWVTPSSVPSTLSSISLKSVISNNSSGLGINAIEVNGTILANSDGSENDSLLDSPTNYDDGTNIGGNYATFNPLHSNLATGGNGAILSNGNLKTTFTTTSSTGNVPATIYVSSGKWYCEFTCVDISSSAEPQIGVVKLGDEIDRYIGRSGNNGVGWEPFRDRRYYAGAYTNNVFGGTTYTSGTHTFGVALDMDDGTVDIYEDGTLLGELATGLSGNYTFAVGDIGGGDIPTFIANFGQRSFKHPPGSTGGPAATFKSLCTQNLDDPLIADGSNYFATSLYDGNGTTGQSITGLEFSPDLVWIKERSSTGGHSIVDTVRGANKPLMPSLTNSEYSKTEFFESFDSNGFTVDYNGVDSSLVSNRNNQTYVAWSWDGGDLATNSAYNQSEVWSDGWVLDSGSSWISVPELSFDGFTGTNTTQTRINGGATWTAGTAVPFTTSLRIWGFDAGSGSIEVNGTDVSSQVQDGTSGWGWNTITGITSPLSTIRITGTTSVTTGIGAVEVDGKILVDTGVIPVGSLNSSAYNQSVVWSNGMTVSSGSITDSSNAFNGSTGNYAVADAFSTNIVVNLGNTLDGVLEVYGSSGATHDVNGQTKLEPNASGWHKVGICTSGTTSTYTCAGASNAYAAIRAIRVAGRILVDQGTTPAVNVPKIATTCRANQTAGLSIISYQGNGTAGATVAHNLNKKPDLLIVKNRDRAVNWPVYHSAVGATKYIALNLTNAETAWAGFLNDTEPTNYAITLGNGSGPNHNGENIIIYAMTAVEGYSAFGKYTGNGNTGEDGVFVWTGFKPRWLMYKPSNRAATDWVMWDTARNSYNIASNYLLANSGSAEGTLGVVDILSNGFKLRVNSTGNNGSGDEIVYLAFAESPFKYARAR